MDNIEQVIAFERFLCEYLGVEKEHLELCRYVDDDGDTGYAGLAAWYTKEADSLASLALVSWLTCVESIEEAMI